MEVEEVQDLLDAGYGVTKIGRIFNAHHTEVSRFIKRNNLEVYEAFDECSAKHKVTSEDIERSYFINDDFKVVCDDEYFEHLRNIRDVGSCNKYITAVKSALELEAMSLFVSHFECDEINAVLLKKYRHIESYLFRHYGSFDNFRIAHDMDVNLIAFNSDKARSFFIMQGNEFEGLVTQALQHIHGDRLITDHRVEGCYPDFVIDGKWLDAKLSKSTALSASCDTISKYLAQTDHLTIIYAIDDIEDVPDYGGSVDFVHISEFYPYMTDELMNDIVELKSAVRQRKEAMS